MKPTEWLTKLAAGVPNAPIGKDAFAVKAGAIFLACSDLRPSCWCEETLSDALRRFPMWPASSEVFSLLSEWSKAHPGATLLALPAPEDPHLARVRRERAEAVADWSDPAKVASSVNKILALVCDRCGASFAPGQAPDGEACIECRSGTVRVHPMRDLLGGMLAGMVQMHAPQNLHLCLPAWIGPRG